MRLEFSHQEAMWAERLEAFEPRPALFDGERLVVKGDVRVGDVVVVDANQVGEVALSCGSDSHRNHACSNVA